MSNHKDIGKMKMDYDLINDSLFLYNIENKSYKESIEVGEDLILDLDKNSAPIAFEILNISKILEVPKFSIKNLKSIEGFVGINQEFIDIKLEFLVPIHQKEVEKPMFMQTANDINLPNIETHLAIA